MFPDIHFSVIRPCFAKLHFTKLTVLALRRVSCQIIEVFFISRSREYSVRPTAFHANMVLNCYFAVCICVYQCFGPIPSDQINQVPVFTRLHFVSAVQFGNNSICCMQMLSFLSALNVIFVWGFDGGFHTLIIKVRQLLPQDLHVGWYCRGLVFLSDISCNVVFKNWIKIEGISAQPVFADLWCLCVTAHASGTCACISAGVTEHSSIWACGCVECLSINCCARGKWSQSIVLILRVCLCFYVYVFGDRTELRQQTVPWVRSPVLLLKPAAQRSPTQTWGLVIASPSQPTTVTAAIYLQSVLVSLADLKVRLLCFLHSFCFPSTSLWLSSPCLSQWCYLRCLWKAWRQWKGDLIVSM